VPHIVAKVLDEGYNFASYFILMENMQKKLWASKVAKSQEKCHLDVYPMANHRENYKGKSCGIPKSGLC
jgi:hypothetical protein